VNEIQEILTAAQQPLETAESLPFSSYTSPAVLAAESQHIFASDWVFVCMAGEVKNSGDYYALTLADEPILILRGDDGELRVLSNLCRHRGTPLLDEGFGQIDKYITCPYHAWAYSKEGALEAIPYNKTIEVDRAQHRLARFAIDTWNGLVFVSLNTDIAPLRFAPHQFNQFNRGKTEYWNANWKLVMENGMESYHLFQVHENTLQVRSPTSDAYYIAGSSEWTLTGGATKSTQEAIEQTLEPDHDELLEHYVLVALPPSFVGIVSYGSFGWLSAHPVDEATTRIRSGATYYSTQTQPSDTKEQLDDFTRAFFEEDRVICERVQRGMRSRHSKGGKLVDMERVVVDFHNYLATRLGQFPKTAFYEDAAAARWKASTASDQ